MASFRESVEKGLGCAVILAGSGSDKPHIEKIAASLDKYGVPYEVRICSAHKQVDDLLAMVHEYDLIHGPLAYIAVAGGTDALSGTVSYHSTRPTISCPPDAPNNSCLTNPPGSSNAYIANPANVGRFLAQMFSWVKPNYAEAIEAEKHKKLVSLQADDNKLREEFTKK
jgi:5-(carboxyamino)imidazole ribonucleotide mutase